MNKLQESLKMHSSAMRLIFYSSIVFLGCFGFPFSNELFPLDYNKGYMIIIGYGAIIICFTKLHNNDSNLNILISTFFLTALGMLCRYFLEYGEFSNTINFIPFNIISFLIVIPAYCTITYWLACKYFIK